MGETLGRPSHSPHEGRHSGACAPLAALSYQGVSKVYVRSHLGRTTRRIGLEDLTLELAPGETLGLLGLNGSGKTTTLKLALGLLAPSSGELRVFGHLPDSRESHRAVGYLPELPYFYPYLSPREALRFFGRLSGIPSAELGARCAAVLEQTGLRPHAERRMAEFSKGMLQRVGLAQAMLHEPRLLLLDEPASGLDPLAITEFRAVLSRLQKEGKSLVLCSHSISEVERLCHRVAILAQGRLVRTLEQRDWSAAPGRLEELFVETVRPSSEGAWR